MRKSRPIVRTATMPLRLVAASTKLAVGVREELDLVGDVVIQERGVGAFLEMRVVAQRIVLTDGFDRSSIRLHPDLPLDPDPCGGDVDADRSEPGRIADRSVDS